MNIIVFFDKDSKTSLSNDLLASTEGLLKATKHKFEIVNIGREDLALCTGCIQCFMKNNGICVNKDKMSEVNSRIKDFDTLIYVGPIVFGQFSSTIKNAMDKSQTIYISRLGKIPYVIAIGYNENLLEQEKKTFIDIFRKHYGESDIVHPLLKNNIDVFTISSINENNTVIEKVRSLINV